MSGTREKRRLLLTLVPALLVAGVVLIAIKRANAPRDYTESVDGVSFTLKAIPGGPFMMGCGLQEEPCRRDEWGERRRRLRQVRVSVAPFYLAETETTWALYQRCIDAGACPDNRGDGGDNGWGAGSRPVIEVSWNEITGAFLPWLNGKTGKRYRLPTEAEWEYAARAGSIGRYSWGSRIDCGKARYGYSSGECGRQMGTAPVRSFPPNELGLYDMYGNVWEFVADCWDGPPSPGSTAANGECQEFVLRGGSWLNEGAELRASNRFRHDRRFRESGDGFRLARDVAP
jgi:formylglycine-generating enzyme required for sulfatase activity